MKRILTLLLALSIVFSGCGAKNRTADTEEWESSSLKTKGSAYAETEETEKETEFSAQSAWLKGLYKTDGDWEGAYILPVTLGEEENVIRMECYEDELLVLSFDTGLNIRLFNLNTGKLDACETFDEGSEGTGDCGFLTDGKIWVYLPAQGLLYYLDHQLEKQAEKTIPSYDVWCSDSQEDIIWLSDFSSDMISSYHIESGKMQEYDLEELLGKSPNVDCLDWGMEDAAFGTVYFSLVEENSVFEKYSFSPASENVAVNELMGNMSTYFYSEGAVYQCQKQYRIVDYMDSEKLISFQAADMGESIIDYQQHYLICQGMESVFVYDCARERYYEVYELEKEGDSAEEQEGCISAAAVRQGLRQIVFSLESPEGKKLILCDLEIAEKTGHFQCSSKTDEEIWQQIEQSRQEIEQKYGIDVLTNEEVAGRKDWSGYILEENNEILSNLDAYETFQSFLDTLPDGMMEEILSGLQGEVEIYFSGSISGEEGSGNLYSAGGYVTDYFDETASLSRTRMVVDISDQTALLRYLPHEFFHMMENRFLDCESDILSREDSIYKNEEDVGSGDSVRESMVSDWGSQWLDLSPYDSYIYDIDETLCYNDDYSVDYVYLSEQNPDGIYFVDAYSRTYPKEDRARIFEYLYMAAIGDEDMEWLESEHIRDKAVYLCQLIRCCYPSADISGRNIWEQVLDEEDWIQAKEM